MIRPARLLEQAGLERAAELLRTARWNAHELAPTLRPAIAGQLTLVALAEPFGRRAYRVLDEQELRSTRRSDTAFVFGSGRSLVDVDDDEWERVSRIDTIGFSHFHRQRWVRVDYHLMTEMPTIPETAASIRANPRYASTVFGLMKGWTAEASNTLVARRMLPAGARIFRWRRIGRSRTLPPSRSLARGLVHGTNSVLDVVNFAIVLGWRRIVIAGVDLYNKEYFFLPPGTARPDEKPHLTAASRWPQADQIVETLALWRRAVEPEGIELFVHDGRSLLAEALPVHRWTEH